MPITVIQGEQRGDEGKGRFVDMYMPDYDIGARFNGGDNAGHTVVVEDQVFKVHGLPTSVVHPHAKSVMGNGVVINAVRLTNEIDTIAGQGVDVTPDNLFISSAAHLTLPHHIYEDAIREGGAGGPRFPPSLELLKSIQQKQIARVSGTENIKNNIGTLANLYF